MPDSMHHEIVATISNKESTVTKKKDVKQKTQTQHLTAIIVNLVTFAYGNYTGWPSPAILALQSENPPVGNQPITDDDASWIGSLMFLGFLCGTPFYSYSCDKFGRKISGLLTSVPIIINWLIIILCDSVFLIFVARFIVGISIGGVFTVVPIYIGEISDVNIRGTLGTYLSILCNGGILFSYIVGAYASYHDFAITCLSVPILFILMFIWMPETPIYLLRNGDYKKAKRSLKWFRGVSEEDIDKELQRMTSLLNDIEQNSKGGVIKDLFLNRGSRKAFIIGIVVSVTQMFSGIYAILSYNGKIFQLAGADIPPHICSIVVGAVLAIAPIISSFLMDRAGRKILVVASLVVMTVCLSVLGVYFFLLEQGTDLSSVGFIPLLAMGLYLLSLGTGIGPVNMVLLSEIFLPHVRSISASAATFSIAVSSFIITRFYNDLCNVIGVYGSFWFFAVCCVLGLIFAITSIPETKNRTVESIHAELNGEKILVSEKNNQPNNEVTNEECTGNCSSVT